MRAILGTVVAWLAMSTTAAAGTSNRLELVRTLDYGIRPVSVTVSPDGAHVYAVGGDQSLAGWSQDAATGQLSLVTIVRDGEGGVEGLGNPKRLTVSPDGAHVYTVSYDGALAVFARNAATGAVSFVEVLRDGVAGVDGLAGASDVAASPDGLAVYVAAGSDQAVTVFGRNPVTGALTMVEVEREGLEGFVGRVALSNDGAHLYAASKGRVTVFARNGLTGALALVGVTSLSGAVSLSLTLSPGGEQLYAGYGLDESFWSHQAIAVLSRDPTSGMLTPLGNTAPPRYNAIREIAVSPDGMQLYGIGELYFGSETAIEVWDRDPATGALELRGSVARRDWGAGGLAIHPSGGYLFSAKAGYGRSVGIQVLARAPVTGDLTSVQSYQDMTFPRALAISADGAHLYVAGLLSNDVTAFARHPVTGELHVTDVERNGAGNVSGLLGPRSIVLSPDGAHLYVATSVGGIVVFAHNAVTGVLDFVETQSLPPGNPGFPPLATVAVSPDGKHVYASSSQGAPGSTIFLRDTATGRLHLVGSADGYLYGFEMAVFNASGTRMYSPRGSYARDPATGFISLFSWFPHTGTAVAVDPTGADVYVSRLEWEWGSPPSEVIRYRADPITGQVVLRQRTPLNVEYDCPSRYEVCSDLKYPPSAVPAISPDGRRIFFDGPTVFTRSTATGAATFADGHVDRAFLETDRPIAIAAGGAQVYVGRPHHGIDVYEPAARCSPLPASGCRLPTVPGKATLKVEQPPDVAAALLAWKWNKGDATAAADFGDPSSADVALCLYDATGLVMTALLPGGETCGSRDCWRATGTTGFRYRDRELTPDGVSRAVLRVGPAGAAKLKVVLQGSNAPVPTLPLALPVISQLQTANGACWSATYGVASLNDATGFFARSE